MGTMAANWIDVSDLSIYHLLLLEKVQIAWLFDFIREKDIGTVLWAHPLIQWYFEKKCPEITDTMKNILKNHNHEASNNEIREAELSILRRIADWIVYATDPKIYDNLEFLKWDSHELTSITDYNNKIVLDIGSGTGRLAFTVADQAKTIFCIEPLSNLRDYIKEKANKKRLNNIFVMDGLITSIPFPKNFSDITITGHVFGDELAKEYRELMRVTKKSGMIILCPGNIDKDNATHDFLIEKGFMWSRFEEPNDGMKRKYWKEK
jgi:SAM-dependent methyltransferase